jgi:hypothetical protein
MAINLPPIVLLFFSFYWVAAVLPPLVRLKSYIHKISQKNTVHMILVLQLLLSLVVSAYEVPLHVPPPSYGYGVNPLLPKTIWPNVAISSPPVYGGYSSAVSYPYPSDITYPALYHFNPIEQEMLNAKIAHEAELRKSQWQKTASEISQVKERLSNLQMLLNGKVKQNQQLANLQKGYEALQNELTRLIKKSNAEAEHAFFDAAKDQILSV